MTRRFAVAAAAFVALSSFALQVPKANAFTSVTKQCLGNARKALTADLKKLRTDRLDQYAADRAACFGPGQACASTCQTTLTNCVANPQSDRSTCNAACNDAFKTNVTACNDNADPLGCATQARITRLTCQTTCSANVQPALDQCNFNYSDCVQQCASCAPGSVCGN
jgi:hypothetical protein